MKTQRKKPAKMRAEQNQNLGDVRIGSYIELDNEPYVVSRPDINKVVMICMIGGNRWVEPKICGPNRIPGKLLREILGESYERFKLISGCRAAELIQRFVQCPQRELDDIARNTHARMVKLQAAVDAMAKADLNRFSGIRGKHFRNWCEAFNALIALATPKAKDRK